MIRSTLLTIAVLGFSFPLAAGADNYVEYIVDYSGSMAKVDSGQRQVDSARTALIKGLAQAPNDSKIALRFYGHRVSKDQMELSCKDTEVVLPFGNTDLVRAREVSSLYEPRGYTPIAHALLQASNDFPSESEGRARTIILLSDGEETCGGDPVEVIKQLKEKGFNVTVHTIGFNVDAKTQALLEAIAEAGNGRYFDAKGADQLYQAVEEASKESFTIDKTSTDFDHGGRAIRGGDDFASAIELPFGELLKLDHHQRKKEYDYFYFDLEPYETISLFGKTLELGVNILPDGRSIESKSSSAPRGAFEVRRDSDNKPLLWSNHIGKFNENTHLFHAHESGRFYLLVGGDYHIHKDGFQFLAERLSFSGEDRIKGGITRESASPLLFGKTLKIDTHLGSD
ncbi:MAG: VWA domain-containing protein, partial [Bdellovibrionales bacterium]|nr:VWA domain-containing protein [Bdellovibrionales bacterium]